MKTFKYSKRDCFYLKLFYKSNYKLQMSFGDFNIETQFHETYACEIRFLCFFKGKRQMNFDVFIVVSKEDFERLFELAK